MAAEMAVFGSDGCGSVRDRIRNGENGFIHHSGDYTELCEQLRAAMAEPAKMPEIAAKARETAEHWPVERGQDILARIALTCVAP
jgi:hypothetical protein